MKDKGKSAGTIAGLAQNLSQNDFVFADLDLTFPMILSLRRVWRIVLPNIHAIIRRLQTLVS
jgi:hypothetical protein